MNLRILTISLLISISLLPLITSAANVNVNVPGVSDASNPAAIVGALYNYALGIGGLLAFGAIVYGALRYSMSGGSAGGQSEAKDAITQALLGLTLLLFAFIFLNILNPDLTHLQLPRLEPLPESVGGPKPGTVGGKCETDDLNCAAQGMECRIYSDGAHYCITPGNLAGGPAGPACQNGVPSGAASEAALANSCFGENANMATRVARGESGGSSIPSGVDVCADGTPASWGIFQINITANKVYTSGGALNCPAAFGGGAYTASNHNCRVTNQALYEQCKQAALDPSINIANACRLSNNGERWGAWGFNNKHCHFPR